MGSALGFSLSCYEMWPRPCTWPWLQVLQCQPAAGCLLSVQLGASTSDVAGPLLHWLLGLPHSMAVAPSMWIPSQLAEAVPCSWHCLGSYIQAPQPTHIHRWETWPLLLDGGASKQTWTVEQRPLEMVCHAKQQNQKEEWDPNKPTEEEKGGNRSSDSETKLTWEYND